MLPNGCAGGPVAAAYADREMSSRRPGRGLPPRVALAATVAASALAMLCGLLRATGYPPLAPFGSGPAALAVTVLAGAVLAALAAVCLALAAGLARASAAVPAVGRAAALREKPWRAGFGRQRDPDAAGRPRPRAPTAVPAAAAAEEAAE